MSARRRPSHLDTVVPICDRAEHGARLREAYQLFDRLGAGLCICDEHDQIVYVNELFHRKIVPFYDGGRMDFVTALVESSLVGEGIRVAAADRPGFADTVRERRRSQSGSISFTSDAADGAWWFVTDSKLDNGWMVAIAQDVTAVKHAEFRLRDAHASAVEAAETDVLTRAPNRRAGFHQARVLLADAQRSGSVLSIALLDIDHFKRVNDVYGHAVGDLALVHFAKVMMSGLHGRDHFSRVGGEEFLLVAPDIDPCSLTKRLTSLLKPVAPLPLGPGSTLQLKVSAGLAAAAPDEPWDSLLHRADLALYEAKANGRDRFEQARPPGYDAIVGAARTDTGR